MRINRVRAALAGTAVFALAATLVVFAPTPSAEAATGSGFDAGFIISDETFYNSGAMSQLQLQSFLNEKGQNCRANSLPCVKDIVLNIDGRAGDSYCRALPSLGNVRAADVFFQVAQSCGINPQVLLVLVEKEQSLVSRTSPSDYSYRYATGFACPDSGGCSSTSAGFVTQVYLAAKQFQRYRVNPGDYNYRAGTNNNILFNPNPGCGSSSVFIRNQATAGLYNYTPYQPNPAALANLYGTGDGCSSYGNRNFWRMFSDWFTNPANLLSTASFEASVGGWGFANGRVERQLAGPTGDAKSGSYFLALYTAVPSRSLSQDASLPVAAGSTYTGSIWVRSASPGTTYSGQLAIWGLGGQPDAAVSAFTVGDAWTEVVTTYTAKTSHNALRLEIYLNSTEGMLFLDNTSLQADSSQVSKDALGITSPSFEEGQGTWGFKNGFMNRQIYDVGAAAHSGIRIMATNTDTPGRSMGQDVGRVALPGENYTSTIWLRSGNGQPFSGTFALWALGSSAEVAATPFTVGADWTPVTAQLPVTQFGTNTIRLEVYLDTVGSDLYIDDASIVPNLVSNPSFETDAANWSSGNSPSAMDRVGVDISGSAIHGSAVGMTNSSFTGSVATDVTRRTNIGEVYVATVWIRSATPGQPWNGEVALWGLGGSTELGLTPVSIGDQWTQVTVTLPVTKQGHTTLRVELYTKSPGVSIFVDSLQLN